MAQRPRSEHTPGGGWFAPALPRVLAHRGLAVEAPENTLLAFVKALATGVDYLETDVHASADGIAIVSHDSDLSRLTGRDVRVGQLTAAELARIDLGEGQGYATLAQALETFPDARFNIDIKDPAVAAPAVAAILAADAADRVLITSFSGGRRLAAVRGLPGVATSISSFGVLVTVLAARLGISSLVRRAMRDVQAIQIPQRVIGIATTSPRVIAAVHGAGKEIHIWTVNDPAVMRTLLDRGVDGIVTDRCDLAMDMVRRRS